ncbi:hypothetical protein A8W25_01080 [Streptomyces sp. ERV7]|uniref:RNase A-like domain-containing protein n=1 Tax=Streptomyces sp. ERV7 TaxID=1322334 RepID=UPI0007F43C46|nr:RNase A-like domain-containing protein [Streptomyces sp. ERV7]OAR26918.1 hypothetical protein A8W25_01080 [Streptomyces sp. ERV7]
MAGPATAPTAGSPNGGFSVPPAELYTASDNIGVQQDNFHKAAERFLDELEKHPDCGGFGTAAQQFADAYTKVGNRLLEVWAKSVAGIGGAAVGFTVTANNYATADMATLPTGPSGNIGIPHHQPPAVIDRPPDYRDVPGLKWGSHDDAQEFIDSALEHVEAVILIVLRPLLEHACRFGKAATILPLPNHQRLQEVAQAWIIPGSVAGTTDGNLVNVLAGITDQTNSDWYTAMRQFCSAVWGTTAWGTNRDGYVWSHDQANNTGMSHPVLAVINDTCGAVSQALHAYAQAAQDVRHDLHQIYRRAVLNSLPHIDVGNPFKLKTWEDFGKSLGRSLEDLSVGIVLHLDEHALNEAVDAYNNRVTRQIPELNKLMAALDEAFLSVPEFRKEEARAEAFGARALTDFKGNPLYTVAGDHEHNHTFPVDLANQEGVSGAHVIDRHVGLTDEQLGQRLRDAPGTNPAIPPKASTFADLATAQRLTQAVLDDPGNQQKLQNYLANTPHSPSSRRELGLTFSQPTGTTWTAGDPAPHPSMNVLVVIRPVPGGHPPYVVLTSMPSDRQPPP